jgi:hypothetical protein
MTTLTTPRFQRRLLQTVREEVANERLGETIQLDEGTVRLGVGIVRQMRDSVVQMRAELENLLADGVEARSFVRSYGAILPDANESLVQLAGLLEELARAIGTDAESFVTELRLLENDTKVFRDLAAEALSRSSQPPRPVDWGRVRASEEAHARGETKPFSRR